MKRKVKHLNDKAPAYRKLFLAPSVIMATRKACDHLNQSYPCLKIESREEENATGLKKQLELLLFNIVMHLNFADKYCVKWNLRERSFGTS